MDKIRFSKLLRTIYSAVDELQAMFPGRHFTPDGHMVGSLGEALAAYHYGIELSGASAPCHDGSCEGRQIQIKTTQGSRIAISTEPEYLLVLRLKRDGEFDEIYNGPGKLVWDLISTKPRPKNGQYQISIVKLQSLMDGVPKSKCINRIE